MWQSSGTCCMMLAVSSQRLGNGKSSGETPGGGDVVVQLQAQANNGEAGTQARALLPGPDLSRSSALLALPLSLKLAQLLGHLWLPNLLLRVPFMPGTHSASLLQRQRWKKVPGWTKDFSKSPGPKICLPVKGDSRVPFADS